SYICRLFFFFFFSSRRRHTRFSRDWSSDVCSSDLDFEKGDIVRIVNDKGQKIGLGRAEFSTKTAVEKIGLSHQKPMIHYDYLYRSEERRVGKECRSRWSTYR